jgi:hypothetical protein
MKKIITLFLVFAFACSQNKQHNLKIVEFSDFKMQVPASWRQIELNGIDSEVDLIVTENGDSINIDFGKNASSLNEVVKVYSLSDKAHFDSINWSTEGKIFSKNSVIEEMQGAYLKEYYLFEIIDGRKAKLMLPKVVGTGGSGVYFDSVDVEGNRLLIYTKDMDSVSYLALYRSLKSIEFNK